MVHNRKSSPKGGDFFCPLPLQKTGEKMVWQQSSSPPDGAVIPTFCVATAKQ